MSSGADGRRELVKALRKAAKDCGLSSEQVPRDTASRDKVQELAGKAAASNGSAEDKAKAAEAFTAYEATWAAVEDSGEEGEDEETFRLRGASFLLTYNWDFFGKAFPDGTGPVATKRELWQLWKTFKAEKKKELKVATWCPHVLVDDFSSTACILESDKKNMHRNALQLRLAILCGQPPLIKKS